MVIDYLTVSAKVDQIYTAIHVDKSTKEPVFEMSSDKVGDAFNGDMMIDYSNVYEKLIEAKLPVLVYAGEFDA